ncbi:hypothetical protein M1N23_00995 [Dehalococcoidia bacterium]|nr:hypothetical protein [Dehalococcoidia bacterium]
MLRVTDQAKEELRRILQDRNIEAGRCLRLAIPPAWPGPGDFGIVVDDEKSDDHTVTLRGVKLMLVGDHLMAKLDHSVLDFKETAFSLDVY